ncbi:MULTISPECIES: retron Ec67 family RNA-directed DNA polymerase/endonuclease [Vibrio]|uniref:retron Ec67 family RNA-directed DNA polymerase/endonuclease n=1 Tax=Vibrio TaxID=662 RepID=UPI00104ED567|nr:MULTISPECIES: retron Ec67 family RNA-directed DNA polymerase/endonuclease [Vibrio]TCV26933.1 RNA-directed DNA polymerase [Vibrio crassostreae]
MNSIEKLKKCSSRNDLSILLDVKPSILSYVLFVESDASKYQEFTISKKTGGERLIKAPNDRLKEIQKSLSDLLLGCIDDINKEKNISNTLSHGFVKEKSIITNAEMHKKSKNILNIDLGNFFDSFNFGRVRGFFIKNNNFLLDPNVATAVAQIACHNNSLPQGSPCSPVITNLITHSLDISLAKLAKKNSCRYTRYADDITFSTRKNSFPVEIMAELDGVYKASKRLDKEISRAGFVINEKKTRIQYKDSRQDVTGLVVNEKVGIKKEYRRTVKAMCNSLFHTGSYTRLINDEHVEGSILELEGRLNFIDSVDRHNRVHYPEKLSTHYQHRHHGIRSREVWSSREKTLSKFLFYKWFYANSKTTILCEGKTDNVYLSSAIYKLKGKYPSLIDAKAKSGEPKSLVKFMDYSRRTKFILELAGGTSYLANFIDAYKERYEFYKSEKPEYPVLIILDNDDGLNDNGGIIAKLQKISTMSMHPTPPKKGNMKSKIKNSEFIHVMHNLYVVITPLNSGNDTMIENLFEQKLWSTPLNKRTFDPTEKKEPKSSYYGKNDFATRVVKKKQDSINFNGFIPLLDRMQRAIEHYKTV